ncbi:hypothetical protein OQI_20610 [Streptomyces pharetrae CZA14]|uniref:Uncharacterized protein n=1 Tax=Streptomyces pharetrae CZA14 TaxID=1144883 RepID=A0ABX3YFV7_9ACTN|nr:hypothetical protein OQI_20610 [Streptomyces pharetrae CZA14]
MRVACPVRLRLVLPVLATGEERLALGRLTAQDTALFGVLWRVGRARVRRKSRKSSGRVQAAK